MNTEAQRKRRLKGIRDEIILDGYLKGYRPADIALSFGIPKQTIHNIIKRQNGRTNDIRANEECEFAIVFYFHTSHVSSNPCSEIIAYTRSLGFSPKETRSSAKRLGIDIEKEEWTLPKK